MRVWPSAHLWPAKLQRADNCFISLRLVNWLYSCSTFSHSHTFIHWLARACELKKLGMELPTFSSVAAPCYLLYEALKQQVILIEQSELSIHLKLLAESFQPHLRVFIIGLSHQFVLELTQLQLELFITKDKTTAEWLFDIIVTSHMTGCCISKRTKKKIRTQEWNIKNTRDNREHFCGSTGSRCWQMRTTRLSWEI